MEVTIRPKLLGGMDEGEEYTKILCQNYQGFPNDGHNRHKLKETRKILNQADIAVILETGTNKDKELMIPSERHRIATENKMPKVNKP